MATAAQALDVMIEMTSAQWAREWPVPFRERDGKIVLGFTKKVIALLARASSSMLPVW